MKTLHIVLIIQQLTGDSEIKFFSSKLKALNFFNEKVKPLADICIAKDLEEDDVYNFYEHKHAVRFNAGYDADLDALLSDCNHYFFLGEIDVEDNITDYVASFSEHVDEYNDIFVGNENNVNIYWNNLINMEVMEDNRYNKFKIDRHDKTTWVDDEGVILYNETENEVYLGRGVTHTFRRGKIEVE